MDVRSGHLFAAGRWNLAWRGQLQGRDIISLWRDCDYRTMNSWTKSGVVVQGDLFNNYMWSVRRETANVTGLATLCAFKFRKYSHYQSYVYYQNKLTTIQRANNYSCEHIILHKFWFYAKFPQNFGKLQVNSEKILRMKQLKFLFSCNEFIF